jgi:hypothetical protein
VSSGSPAGLRKLALHELSRDALQRRRALQQRPVGV